MLDGADISLYQGRKANFDEEDLLKTHIALTKAFDDLVSAIKVNKKVVDFC